MRFMSLMLVSLLIWIQGVPASAQSEILQAVTADSVLSQGVPAACLLALVLNYILKESPQRTRDEQARTAVLAKMEEAIHSLVETVKAMSNKIDALGK